MNITNKSDLESIKRLIEQIDDLLNTNSSLTRLLIKAARLANLVEDNDILGLFEIHLEGLDGSTKDALEKQISRMGVQGGLSLKTAEMFMYDRRTDGENFSSHSAEDLELILAKYDSVVSEGNFDSRTFQTRNELARIIRSIKYRVGGFVREVERAVQQLNVEVSITGSGRVFIGHGRSPIWRNLKDFLQDSLKLDWDEFNREETAGKTTLERLDEMLREASFAFLIMTGEDEYVDQSVHARPNVIHEIGLFQGKLSPRRAIVLLEEGCQEFSNIIGLTQIRFPKGDILARSEQIRNVLKREGILKNE